MLLQITDDNYVEFLAGWQFENKPSVLLFDQVPHVPLIYKVSNSATHTAQIRCLMQSSFCLSCLRIKQEVLNFGISCICCIRVFECIVSL